MLLTGFLPPFRFWIGASCVGNAWPSTSPSASISPMESIEEADEALDRDSSFGMIGDCTSSGISDAVVLVAYC